MSEIRCFCKNLCEDFYGSGTPLERIDYEILKVSAQDQDDGADEDDDDTDSSDDECEMVDE